MKRYEGAVCPICKQTLSADDPVAVCPDCGTPYHRACIQKTGRCVFADRHAEGYRFEPPKRAETRDGQTISCPACGRQNPPDGLYCDACGAPLSPNADTPPFTGAFGGGAAFVDAHFTPPDPAEEIDGVTVRDLTVYVGENARYFIPRFQDLKTGGRRFSQINFCALLFQHWYFLYRKMWGLAALSFVTSLLTALPVTVMSLYDMGFLGGEPNENLLTTAYFAGYLVFTLVRVLLAVFCNRLYLNGARKRIRRLRLSTDSESDYSSGLMRIGGVSRMALLLCGAVYVSLVFAGWMLMMTFLS